MTVIRQLHYTSLDSGPDGRRGFQISAASTGLSRSLEDAAISASVYRPPGVSRTVSTDEVDLLPVSLGYMQSDGTAILYQSRYVGEDFAGRQGNYFAHALVADMNALGDLRPIETWQATLWQSAVVGPRELPTLSALQGGGVTDRAGTDRFLQGRTLPLRAVVSAVQAALIDPRESVVIVCADAEVAALWIAAVTHALPRHLALAVTFTTYSATPLEADAMLIGTVPDVAVLTDAFRPQSVLDMTAGDLGVSCTPYASLVGDAWSAGPERISELVGLAEQVRPPLTARELDVLADVDRLLHDQDVDQGNIAAVAAFTQERLGPSVLNDLLANAVHLVPAEGLSDLDLWSRVLSRGERHHVPLPGPLVESFARGLLATAAHGGSVATVQVPAAARMALDRVAVDWARSTVASDGSASGVRAMLTSLDVLRVRLPDAELTALADRVLLPALLADPTTATADVVRADHDFARIRRHLGDAFERSFSQDTSVADARGPAASEVGLPVPAARLLHRGTQPGSLASERVAEVLVCSGDLARLEALLDLLDGDSPPSASRVGRLLARFWDEPPTAEEGLRLLRDLDGDMVAGTGLPDLLVQRLLDDAHRGGLEVEHAELAEELARRPVGDALGSGRAIVEAIRLGAFFRGTSVAAETGLSAAERAVTLTGEVGQDVADWVLRGVAEWLLTLEHPIRHAQALEAVFELAPPRLEQIYGTKAEAILSTADPRLLAAVVPGWLHLAQHHQVGRHLVDSVLPAILQRRSRRELEHVGDELHRITPRLGPLLPALQAHDERSWESWWDSLRLAHERPSLLKRALRRRRGGA